MSLYYTNIIEFLTAPYRPGCGELLQPAKSPKQRVGLHIGQVAQPAPANDQHRNQQSDHRHRTEVGPCPGAGKRLAHELVELYRAQVPIEKLKPRIRRQRNIPELELQISVDTRDQIGFSSSHYQWPFVGLEGLVLQPPFNHNGRPFSICHLPLVVSGKCPIGAK